MTAPSRLRRWALKGAAFTVVLSAPPLAALVGRKVQVLARGSNFSDVGVPMYPHEGPGVLLGMAVSCGLCGAVLWSVLRLVPSCRGLVAWFGMPWLLACNALLVLAMALGF